MSEIFKPQNNYDIVEFHFAKWLKLDGFDEPCRAYYDFHTLIKLPMFLTRPVRNSLYKGTFIAAPTIWEVERYFRDRYHIDINTITAYTGVERVTNIVYYPVISAPSGFGKLGIKRLDEEDIKVFGSKEEALYHALKIVMNFVAIHKDNL